MIETVEFKNFKALRDVTMNLAPFTLIVGPNASGKTSMLEGLHYLVQLGTQSAESFFSGERSPDVLCSCGARGPMSLAMEGHWGGAHARVQRNAVFDGKKWAFASVMLADGQSLGLDAPKGQSPRLPAPALKLLDAMRSAALLRLDPKRLAEPSYSAGSFRAEFDGANLGAALADLALADPASLQELLNRVRAVVPAVESVAFDRVMIEQTHFAERKESAGLFERVHNSYQGYAVRLAFRGVGKVPAYAVSEGTLITLGLLTVLSRQPVPRLVMIDELERGLHPKALGELVRQIRAIMERFPDLQVIGTTHSPYLVDHFQSQEIRLTTMRDDGSVLVGSLSEHPDFERWKDEMKPGEFWSSVGEDWLRDRKAPANE